MFIKKIYKEGETIITQGDFGTETYQLVSGTVEVSFTTPDGIKTTLALLKPPHIFGEMALIDDKPRSATVKALSEVVVFATQKEDFVKNLYNIENTMVVPILKNLFERLRTSNQIISTLTTDMAMLGFSDSSNCEDKTFSLSIKPTTEDAKVALGSKKFDISYFPFRIGRKDITDVLGINDLILSTETPSQVSPHHLLISTRNNAIVLSDRGSRYGSFVNGCRIGLTNRSKVVELNKGDNEVIFGDIYSPLRYNFEVS